jgi:hypothetical protein
VDGARLGADGASVSKIDAAAIARLAAVAIEIDDEACLRPAPLRFSTRQRSMRGIP